MSTVPVPGFLVIGNPFTQIATRYIHELAKAGTSSPLYSVFVFEIRGEVLYFALKKECSTSNLVAHIFGNLPHTSVAFIN
jgi:hypothetical protein